MRLKKFTATLAASALAFGLTAGVAQAEPQQPIKVDSQGVVTGSHIQNLYSHMGKYKTVSTMKAQDCGLVYKIYAKILEKDHNNKMKHTCWGTFPDGTKKPADVQFVYPENIAELGKLPVIIYTPGIGAEAGLTEHLYHMWATATSWSSPTPSSTGPVTPTFRVLQACSLSPRIPSLRSSDTLMPLRPS